MKKIRKYQQILIEFLQEYAKYTPVNLPNTENKVIIDKAKRQYLMIRVGWKETRFVHDLVFHFEISEKGKVLIFANWTDVDITEDWILQGMLKSDIVLAFHPEYLRENTGFAVVA